ncbi:MAG TPA: hypothetical protein VHG28_15770 [Longimicrobiaceae bacterium]|nr:hypothetical protein [Longimicrobiaceae bacterium]
MLQLTPSEALALVERVGAVAVLISSLEMLARPGLFADAGLLSWSTEQLRARWLTHGSLARVLQVAFRPPAVLWIVGLRTAAATAVIASPRPHGVLVGAVALTSLLLMLRNTYGNDGADQLGLITFVAASFAHLFTSPVVIAAVLWFLALQGCLGYFTSGVAKLAGPRWRNGTGLVGVFETQTYGARTLSRMLREHPRLAVASSWAVIVGEALFPVTLVAPQPIALALLAFGASFHLGAAAVMGLNTFLWAFPATYPAIWYCAQSWR